MPWRKAGDRTGSHQPRQVGLMEVWYSRWQLHIRHEGERGDLEGRDHSKKGGGGGSKYSELHQESKCLSFLSV